VIFVDMENTELLGVYQSLNVGIKNMKGYGTMFNPTEMYIFQVISRPIDKLFMKSWSLDVAMLVISRYF
jgi:hypothetical protein